MNYILFSPVGKTDPITNYHDGSLLHISRHYQPEIIYLYMSKEMSEFHHLDNRYCKCLEWLQKKENFISEIHVIERPDLVDVQLFDYFYDEFDAELQKIHEAYPNHQILLNVSSGTPAMKSGLQFLAASSEHGYRAIQVATPQKGVNKEAIDFEDYDLDTRWELNEDNENNSPNRCIESATMMLNKRIKLEVIRNHLNAYDYQAALNVAKTIETLLPENIMFLLEGATKRMNLDYAGAIKAFAKTAVQPMPRLSSDKAPVIEYILWLQAKQQRGDLADFIRGITPVIVDIFELILKEKYHIKLSDFCERNSKGVWCLSRQNFLNNLPELLSYIEESYGELIQKKPISSHILLSMLEKECHQPALYNLAKELREIEQSVRNTAAHEIVSITEDFLLSKTGKKSSQILNLMKQLIQQGLTGIKNEVWNSYDEMNTLIIAELAKNI